jgi:hypothetical protein
VRGLVWEPLRRSCLGLVAFGIEDDEAAWAIAGRGRGEAGLGQDQVEHAALARGHGRKREGATCGSYLLDGCFGGELEIAVARGLEAFGVEADAVVVLGFEAENLGGDVLDGVEEFAVVSQEQRGVGAGQLYLDVGN